MPTPLTYAHPTFVQFLQFHLGEVTLWDDEGDPVTAERILSAMEANDFPFADTELAADVYCLDEVEGSGRRLMCQAGESVDHIVRFLVGKLQADRDIKRSRTYGPVHIRPCSTPEQANEYYRRVVHRTLAKSVNRALYADPVTMRMSWYGQVNAHEQGGLLRRAVKAITELPGASTQLTPHLNTARGAEILTDSTRAACLVVSLLRQAFPDAQDGFIHTTALAALVQHFAALVDEERPFHAGQLAVAPNQDTVAVLEGLGLDADQSPHPLAPLGVDPVLLFELVLNTHRVPRGGPKSVEIGCLFLGLANHIVAHYFTETRYVEDDENAFNPCFGSVRNTGIELDRFFGREPLYKSSRASLFRFLHNADYFYRLHTRHRLLQGQWVSPAARRALELVE